MILKPIDRINGVSPDTFNREYLQAKKPVVITDFIKESPALTKWNYDYLKEKAGNLTVSLYGKEDAFNDHVNSLPVSSMKFAEYLDLIATEPTELRLFLFNLLSKVPELKKDILINDVTGGKVISWLPYMFFGGAGSSVRNHYDIDMSHVFLSQFDGEKRVWLFPLEQSDLMYKLPFNFHGIANLKEPDFEKFPAVKYAEGWECDLKKGETLLIPSGFWHYIQYTTGGYSISYRALSSNITDRLRGFSNIVLMRRFDNTMRRLFKDKWFDYKVKTATKRAEQRIASL